MSTAKKLLDRMRANPKGDWQISDLKTVARHHGYTDRQHGTSHVVFSGPGGRLTVPARRPIKPPYIREFVELIDTGIHPRSNT